MAPESRTQDPDVSSPSIVSNSQVAESFSPAHAEIRVEQVLREHPWDFQFFQAVRLLQRYSNGRSEVGRFASPENEAVRFTSNPALQFPASQIAGLRWTPGETPRMAVNFLGLLGQLGVLPLPYCEYLNDQIRARDTTLQEFLDIFNHRFISLFYQAWVKHRFHIGYERNQEDRLTQYLRDFIGLGTPGLKERQAVRDEAFLFYTGLLSLQPRSELAIKHMLRDYFDVEVSIEPFIGSWHPLSPDDQCRVGEEHLYSEQLGLGAVAGHEMWDIQSRARVILGPMRMEKYVEFLPGGSAHHPLREILQFFSNREISFEAQLLLAREDVPTLQLGVDNGPPARLAWTTWIKNTPFTRDPGDTVLDIT